MNIKLPILFHTDNTLHLDKLDLDTKLKDYEVKEIRFYEISAIGPYLEAGKDYTMIYTNGFDFICPLPTKEVELRIQQNKATYAN